LEGKNTKMKKVINNVAHVVSDCVDGLLLSNPHLKKVQGFNIVVRADIEEYKKTHVTLISGGGSGHEPAHAGFIGDGMLSGAVLGNVFASPSVASILTAIQVCAGPKGVLVIIKNYTGDRLNFGMAIEKAKLLGINVKMVIVADDCALPIGKGITGGRGVAGTIFVHKIAGALAANPASTLGEVHGIAHTTASSIGSMGVALSVCCVPGAQPSDRLNDATTIEVGMGIHGEPGREQRAIPTVDAAKELAEVMVESIIGPAGRIKLGFENDQAVAVILNNLGGLSVLELSICAREVIANLRCKGIRIHSIHSGSFMTSMNMHGVSLSLLKVRGGDVDLRSQLDASTTSQSWLASFSTDLLNSFVSVDEYLIAQTIVCSSDTGNTANTGVQIVVPEYAHQAISAACNALIALEPTLTQYDTVCGDGDCGLSLKAGATFVLERLQVGSESDTQWGNVFTSLADSVSLSMGGTLGAIIEILFRAMAVSLNEVHSL
jgi:dihydroxyacetone kinase